MNAVTRMVGGPLDRSEAVDHGHPDDFQTLPYNSVFFIASKLGYAVEPNIYYATRDEAEEQIQQMMDDYEQEQRERRRREDETPRQRYLHWS